MVKESGKVALLCEPCGETACNIQNVEKVSAIKVEKKFYELLINGKSQDLAYVYIWKDAAWQNLAMQLGIEVTGVSKTITEVGCKGKPVSSNPESTDEPNEINF